MSTTSMRTSLARRQRAPPLSGPCRSAVTAIAVTWPTISKATAGTSSRARPKQPTSRAATVGNQRRWRDAYDAAPTRRDVPFETMSGVPVEPVYGPPDRELPGQWPFTRGPYASMYRSKLWTMRMFAGFGTAEDTNARFKELLRAGGTGLSTAFDMPTLMGRDSDDALARGEVGRAGVAVDTLADVESLFDGIDLGTVSTSMTVNSPASILLAMYVVLADCQGVPRDRLGGTIQNDILKEYQAQKEFIFPPRPSLRLVNDVVRFCAAELPRWHPISISGYHIREAGSTAVQELAFTLANGFAYVEQALRSGLEVDGFAPRLSFFFNAHIDFFEEVAKYRAARRIWARWMRERYGAHDERSMQLRFHTQTAGVSLTAQQPEVNIVRTAIEALAGVLGGTQSLHTNSMDEAMALPTERAARIALRTQQVLAYETNVAHVADPLGGSYFVEWLTDEMERQAEEMFAKIDELGGMVKAIEQNYPQREIADAAYRYQEEVDAGQRIVVGVNGYQVGDEPPLAILRIAPELERKQVGRVQAVRAGRDGSAVETALTALRAAAATDVNLMDPLLDCARAHCTEGEIVESLQRVFGTYTETPVF